MCEKDIDHDEEELEIILSHFLDSNEIEGK